MSVKESRYGKGIRRQSLPFVPPAGDERESRGTSPSGAVCVRPPAAQADKAVISSAHEYKIGQSPADSICQQGIVVFTERTETVLSFEKAFCLAVGIRHLFQKFRVGHTGYLSKCVLYALCRDFFLKLYTLRIIRIIIVER